MAALGEISLQDKELGERPAQRYRPAKGFFSMRYLLGCGGAASQMEWVFSPPLGPWAIGHRDGWTSMDI